MRSVCASSLEWTGLKLVIGGVIGILIDTEANTGILLD